ncbi:aminotransferase, partial [Mycobacterium sp. ITM-2017-0098]
RPLSTAEADALWPMLVLRTAVLIVSGAQQAVLDPDNDYITAQSDDERRMFELATSIPLDVMTAVIKADLGLAEPTPAVPVQSQLIAADRSSVVTLDLSATSDLYDDAYDAAGVLPADVEDEFAGSALQRGASLAVTRFGEARLCRAPRLSQDSPEVVATGVDLWTAADTDIAAPWDGEVIDGTASITVRGMDFELTMLGATASRTGAVSAGDVVGRAPARRRIWLSVRPAGAPAAPQFVAADVAPGWLAYVRDPRPLLGLAPLDQAGSDDLLARRDASFAPVQEFYYHTPPQIERGR